MHDQLIRRKVRLLKPSKTIQTLQKRGTLTKWKRLRGDLWKTNWMFFKNVSGKRPQTASTWNLLYIAKFASFRLMHTYQ